MRGSAGERRVPCAVCRAPRGGRTQFPLHPHTPAAISQHPAQRADRAGRFCSRTKQARSRRPADNKRVCRIRNPPYVAARSAPKPRKPLYAARAVQRRSGLGPATRGPLCWIWRIWGSGATASCVALRRCWCVSARLRCIAWLQVRTQPRHRTLAWAECTRCGNRGCVDSSQKEGCQKALRRLSEGSEDAELKERLGQKAGSACAVITRRRRCRSTRNARAGVTARCIPCPSPASCGVGDTAVPAPKLAVRHGCMHWVHQTATRHVRLKHGAGSREHHRVSKTVERAQGARVRKSTHSRVPWNQACGARHAPLESGFLCGTLRVAVAELLGLGSCIPSPAPCPKTGPLCP